ncbi:OLC1v1005305C1 [Oldenlandia corymbosa var. corymbosa]|uniref:OLC1v1005305C1 n=1 Tax=Oldenlandia corymbosa var. corymbosa TaxID=529605 RepID=A0AAV1DGB0_OLDCO|nr:OLC1v1005305C1 [Oldenlandia corymbosa var. corymbosa]
MFILPRSVSLSAAAKRPDYCFSLCLQSVSSADEIMTHLLNNGSDMETSLNRIKIRLDAECINKILQGVPLINIYWVLGSSFGLVFNLGIDTLRTEAKDANLGFSVLSKMKEFNCRPDMTAYNLVIRLLLEKGEIDELEDACRLIKAMKGHGCLPNSIVYSALLDGLCKFGTFERAIEMLAEMEKEDGDTKPNVLTDTILIQNFCEKVQSMNGLRILDRMRDFGCKPNRITMRALIKGLCSEGHIDEIGKLEESEMAFKKMLARGFRPDGAASSTVMRQLCLAGRPRDAFHLYEAVEMSGSVTIDTDLYSVLLVALSEEKHILYLKKNIYWKLLS